MCAYTLVDASAIPLRKRAAFVATSLQRWSPFADTAHHVEWVGDQAMAWAWSRDQVLDLPDEAEVEIPRRVLPEALFLGVPSEQGAELVKVSEGVEGRIWSAGVLRASEWWPTSPTVAQWAAFLRGAGRLVGPVPPVLEPGISDVAWTRRATPAWGDVAHRHRGLAASVALGLAVLLLAFPVGGALRLLAQTAAVEDAIQSQDAGLQRILAARESAERDAAEVERLLALRPPAGQLQLMAAVAAAMPPSGWQLLEWRLVDRQTLEVDVQMANPDPRALVQAWESSGQFDEVTAELGRSGQEVGLRARVVTPALAVVE